MQYVVPSETDFQVPAVAPAGQLLNADGSLSVLSWLLLAGAAGTLFWFANQAELS